MIKKLTKTGNSVALVLERPILEQLGVDEDSEVEVSTNGDVVVISPVRDADAEEAFKRSVEKIHTKYAGLFRRLSQ